MRRKILPISSISQNAEFILSESILVIFQSFYIVPSHQCLKTPEFLLVLSEVVRYIFCFDFYKVIGLDSTFFSTFTKFATTHSSHKPIFNLSITKTDPDNMEEIEDNTAAQGW